MHATCDKCGQRVRYDADSAGTTMACLGCGADVFMPLAPFATCGKCGERVNYDAKSPVMMLVCPGCGSDVARTTKAAPSTPPLPPVKSLVPPEPSPAAEPGGPKEYMAIRAYAAFSQIAGYLAMVAAVLCFVVSAVSGELSGVILAVIVGISGFASFVSSSLFDLAIDVAQDIRHIRERLQDQDH